MIALILKDILTLTRRDLYVYVIFIFLFNILDIINDGTHFIGVPLCFGMLMMLAAGRVISCL